jgi:sterol desaturase/sphingolipid hydroxylase (fatty acid hydroxylase superfamily)
VLLGCGIEVLALFTLISAVHGISQHANVQLRLGPLNHFCSMAELHRWHDSKTIEEANRNYGQTIIVWGTLFGTRFLPLDRRPPEGIGIPNLSAFPRIRDSRSLEHLASRASSAGEALGKLGLPANLRAGGFGQASLD